MTSIQKKYTNYLIKIAVVGLAMWFVYSKVTNQKSLQEFKAIIVGLDQHVMLATMLVVVLLMLVNWLLEVRKWRYLTRDLEPMSAWKGIKAVFSGLTWAIFTPNRIGEYGGRVMLLRPRHRGKGVVLMGVGLFAQLVLTSFFGSLSIAWFISTFIDAPTTIKFGGWILAIIYALAFVLLYFNVHWIDYLVSKVKFLKKIKPFFSVLEEVSTKTLFRVLMISLARFVIFTSQYIILMLVLLPELPLVSLVLMIFILFFVQAAMPSIDIFDFSVRSFVASNLYSYVTTKELVVMAIVSCVWFVNLILPAIIGSFFVLNVNYIGDNNT